jgi:hypothetical protein
VSQEILQDVPRGLELPDFKTTVDHFFHRPVLLLDVFHIFTFPNQGIEVGHNFSESWLIHGGRIVKIGCESRFFPSKINFLNSCRRAEKRPKTQSNPRREKRRGGSAADAGDKRGDLSLPFPSLN